MGVIMGHSQDHIPITLVATDVATHWFVKVALIGVICLWPLRSWAENGEKALALRQNVVKVWSGQGNTENGFGFIVSAGAGNLYVITADHVAWGTSAPQPDAEAPSIYLAFYADPSNRYRAKILNHDRHHDLALLQVQIPPGIKWEKQCLSTIEEAKRNTPVWFIGRDGEWFVPALSGAIDSDRPNADSWLEAEVLGLRPGSSGGPLVSRTGIVGMVNAGSADEARVLAIEYIKNAVQDWGYPWSLTIGTAIATGATTNSVDLPSGEAILFDGNTRFNESGFSFVTSATVPWDSGKADILFAGSRLFTQNDVGDHPGEMQNAPADVDAHGGLQAAPMQSFNGTCPVGGYVSHWFPPDPSNPPILTQNAYFCVQLRDGKHYAKIKITHVEPDRIGFEWVYQPNGSRTFQLSQ